MIYISQTLLSALKPLALSFKMCYNFTELIIIISNLSDDRSKASSEKIPPLNAIESFLLQMRVSSPVSNDLAHMVSQFLETDYPGKGIMW
jgi:hypothetical protein